MLYWQSYSADRMTHGSWFAMSSLCQYATKVIRRKRKEYNKEMTGEPIHITDDAFEKVVMQSQVPVIVDFWAPWCNPCKMIAPTLDKLAKEQDGKLIVAKVNTDENAEWMNKFGIQGIPTLLFISGGKVVHRQVGALPERMLREIVTQFMDVIGHN
jgi:thioredoxin 1